LSVIGDWLRNTKQRVCIKGKWSSWISVCSGVPQGYVLGPLLFLIFINDLDEDITSNILKFADDTKIFKEVRNSTDCSQLQADLDKLVLCAKKRQMEFNVDKCKVMHVGNSDSSSSYYMEGSELSEVSYEKDLGVWVSSDMKCSKQCLYAFDKATSILGMIKRTIRFKDIRVMLSLYKTS